jgi:hypothetical protein
LIVVSNLRFGGILGEEGGYFSAFVPGVTAEPFRLWPRDDDPTPLPDPTLGDPSCTTPPPPDAFYPHGLTSRSDLDRVLIYVVAHAGSPRAREAVEIFELAGRGTDSALTWKGCIPTPGKIQGNDIVLSADGEKIVMSNFEPDSSLRHMFAAGLFGVRTGNVLTWTRETGWKAVEGSDAEMANGVALARRGETVLYTETMTGLIHRLPIEHGGGAIEINIGGNPDNFTQTPRGSLLVATHTGGTKFMLCRFGRLPCATSWEVWEMDPETLAMHKVIAHDGSTVGAVATALEVDGVLYLGSVYDDRIGVVTTSNH